MVDYTGGRTLDDLIEFVEAQVEGDSGEDEEEEPQEPAGETEEEPAEEAEAKKDEL